VFLTAGMKMVRKALRPFAGTLARFGPAAVTLFFAVDSFFS